MRTWLGETNRPVYPIGPLIPPGFGDTGLSVAAKQMEVLSSKNGAEFQTFLDSALESHGARSVIYVNHTSSRNLANHDLYAGLLRKLLLAKEG
jgi:hypothetical protein